MELAMNAFYEHHQDSIVMHDACFDRILLDARIPAFWMEGGPWDFSVKTGASSRSIRRIW